MFKSLNNIFLIYLPVMCKNKILQMLFFLFFLETVFSQLAVPLVLSKIATQSQPNSNFHRHQLRQSQQNVPKKISSLFHNSRYINHYYSKPSLHKLTKSHQLTTIANEKNVPLQTFKLEQQTFSFSLEMKIAGYDYKMNIDSGSSDIFIKGQNAAGKPLKRYQCGKACLQNNDRYSIRYLDGALETYEKELEVQIGTHKFNQSILVAYNLQHNFQENQGLVGLSFPELATNPNPTFLQTLKNQAIINSVAFGVNLNFQNKSRCFITFGSYDTQFFEGDLKYLPFTSNLFYYVQSEGVSLGDGEILKIRTAIFDTGNTCISIPSKYQADILKKFNIGSGQNQNKCYFQVQQHAPMFSIFRCRIGDFNQLPILNIHLNRFIYSIQKQYYMQACDRRPKDLNQSSEKSQGIWYCDMYIESVNGMHQLFLGDGFFNRFYTYFNLENKQIGIAKNKETATVEKIIQANLEANPLDWKNILLNLNPEENPKDIQKQIKKVIKQKI